MRLLKALALLAIGGAACGGEDAILAPAPANSAAGGAGAPAGVGACNLVHEDYDDLPPAYHVATCSPLDYVSNPPCYGDHYPVWAAYKAYDQVVPRGFWIHDLEHGGVVITYNCPDGCADEVAAAKAMLDAQPDDPTCDPAVRHRLVLVPDPLIPTRFAISAWGHLMRADCFDHDAFQTFVQTHYDHGTEELCADGVDVIAEGLDPSCGK